MTEQQKTTGSVKPIISFSVELHSELKLTGNGMPSIINLSSLSVCIKTATEIFNNCVRQLMTRQSLETRLCPQTL